IINVALVLAGCLAFYKLLLQRETFYRLNRYVLITCLFIAFALPFVRVPEQFSFRKAEPAPQVTEAPATVQPSATINPTASTPREEQQTQNIKPQTITFPQVMTWLVYLYWFGVIVFALNFLVQIGLLLYRAYSSPVIKDGQFRIVEVSGDKAPCSFGNNLFINPAKYDWDTYNQILLHEKVHIQQRHTLDIVLAELVLILQWFNPFAWVYRKEVENNLEFLTDDQLVQHQEIDPASYQLSLLKVSTPHFPLSLTTNYNQSLLKKRIVMMNAKKSNVHTAWKYFFLLPVLVMFACLLNEPLAQAQDNGNARKENKEKTKHYGLATEGSFFATIKNDKLTVHFKEDENDNSMNSTTFNLSEVNNLPREGSGVFTVKREAGTMEFTGKFEGDQGMGKYRFLVDRDYVAYMDGQVDGSLSERDAMTFFFVNVTRSYVEDLRGLGYSGLDKGQLIPLAALKVDRAYISSIKEQGYKDVELQELIPLKALNVNSAYIREIREAGYKDVSLQQLVTLKAQGIDKEYLSKMRGSMPGRGTKDKGNKVKDKGDKDKDGNGGEGSPDVNDVVTFKALKIDDTFINSFKEVGLTDLSNSDLVSMKSVGVTPDYIKSMQALGYRDVPASTWVSMKALGVTPDYVRSWTEAGYSNLNAQDLIPLKAQKITPDFGKSFESVGFRDISVNQLITLKAMGITPAYISSMKEKGFNYSRIDKYVTLKSIE
ncbi:MAG TPA: M56 family metallopeptidase, partial [Chitinophagaceae bacterium]|nr:M56 family metallopeptidase [Chitinophagaceae bacterium]